MTIWNRQEVNSNATAHLFTRVEWSILAATIIMSVAAFAYYFFTGTHNLADYDAIARLNIARKMIDSLTPGLGQLGGIWLPFPQLLMLPFIGSDFLWHSGIAGALVSMPAFIASSFFIYRLALHLTKKQSSAVLAWFVFSTNVNLLFLQSMAMSEAFFIFSIVLTLYYLQQWADSDNILHLIACAFFVMIATLTRYEGYFVLFGALASVLSIAMFKYHQEGAKKIEGTMLLFGTLAGYGIVMWMLYSALIYKDPLYWLHLYQNVSTQIPVAWPEGVTAAQGADVGGRAVPVAGALRVYVTAMMFMNGIVYSLVAVVGFCFMAYQCAVSFAQKRPVFRYIPLMLIAIMVFAFMVVGYRRGMIPTIEVPPLTLKILLDKSYNFVSHSNIRYGIVPLPFIALYLGYIASRKKILTIAVTCLVVFQLVTTVYSPLFLQFQMPQVYTYSSLPSAVWFRAHYDTGPILVSAHRFENFMFQTGLPYESFIYEGSRTLWTDSLSNPAKYAQWVVFSTRIKGDAVYEYMSGRAILEDRFELVYDYDGLKIYRIQDKPDIDVSSVDTHRL